MVRSFFEYTCHSTTLQHRDFVVRIYSSTNSLSCVSMFYCYSTRIYMNTRTTTGTLSAEDLEKAFGKSVNTKEMISRLDINGDGSIDYNEFLEMMRAE